MGYTHYYTKKREHTNEEWDKFIGECKQLHKSLPDDVLIAGWNGFGKPIFNDEEVSFNGSGDELSHETCLIEKESPIDEFNFCKTNRKPYDLMVVAVLLSANKNLGHSFHSDGDLDDLRVGIDFYTMVTGYHISDSEILDMLNT